MIGDPIFVGIPTEYYGWIRDVEREQYCQSIDWDDDDCSFVTDSAVCIADVGCFVRPY